MNISDDPTTSVAAGNPQATQVESRTPPGAGSDSTQAEVAPPKHLFYTEGLPDVPGYKVTRIIAQGGMGIVYAANDPTFDREVAIKVMHPGQDAERFVIESKVTAQLPHPGVPPVYALGTLRDGRPFLAMKLIAGRTLAELLAAYATDTHRSPELLGIFEQICQTVGFAHAHGIIHRDLKPANVMAGAFGEVLVMDWGLARSIRNAEFKIRNEGNELADSAAIPHSAFRIPHSTETQAGQVKGTPAYMAPEQARGEMVDARADVFALGGILTVMLTGKPPWSGNTAIATVQKACQGELSDCFIALDKCAADAELIAVAKRCLAPTSANRYADGTEVAAAVAAYRAGVEARLRQAERERAASEVRAIEQRKKRKVQLALAAALALLLAAGGGFAWWEDRQASDQAMKDERAETERKASEAKLEGQRDTEQRMKAEQAQEGVAANLKLAANLREQHKYKEASAAIQSAADLAKRGVPALLPEVEQARADLAFVEQLDDIRYRKWVWITDSDGTGNFNTKIAAPEYSKAFAERGLDLTTLELSDAAKRIAASNVKAELVAAIDDWSLYEPNPVLQAQLINIAKQADPGKWTDRLRNSIISQDKKLLLALAADTDPATTPAASLVTLAELMKRSSLNPAPLLLRARSMYPNNFELAFAHGLWLANNSKDGQQIGPYEAARALRPEKVTVWNNLGLALYDKGDVDGAIAALRETITLDPKLAVAHNNLGVALKRKGDLQAAIAAYKESVKHDPTYANAHNNLGSALRDKGDMPGAIAAYKNAVKHNPKYAIAYSNLGFVLITTGDIDGAIAAYKGAIKYDPKAAVPHFSLGIALRRKGDIDGAIAAFKEAVKYDPAFASAHSTLGAALREKGDADGAIAAYKEAVKHDPTNVTAHNSIGLLLRGKGDVDGAIAAYKEAIKHNPKYAIAYNNMGRAYLSQKNLKEAIAAARGAIKADPKYGSGYALLGDVLEQTGDIAGARAAYIEAAKLDKKWAAKLANVPPLAVAPAPRAK